MYPGILMYHFSFHIWNSRFYYIQVNWNFQKIVYLWKLLMKINYYLWLQNNKTNWGYNKWQQFCTNIVLPHFPKCHRNVYLETGVRSGGEIKLENNYFWLGWKWERVFFTLGSFTCGAVINLIWILLA